MYRDLKRLEKHDRETIQVLLQALSESERLKVKRISRLDLADFTSPERIADAIIRSIPDLPIPVPIDELALMLDIISIEALETEGFEGGLLTDAEKSAGYILVNEASSTAPSFHNRSRIGAFPLSSHMPPTGITLALQKTCGRLFAHESDRAARIEVEANRFAALILMPLSRFRGIYVSAKAWKLSTSSP